MNFGVGRERALNNLPRISPTRARPVSRKKRTVFDKWRRASGDRLLQVAGMKKPQLRNILVPVDFSPLSAPAIETALRLGKRSGAAIHLVYVHQYYYPIGFMAPGAPVPMSVATFRADTARIIADQMVALAKKHGIPASNCHVQNGGPVFNEVCLVAKEINADLIVTPTHGYTGAAHFFEGSTAERIVQHSPCPVYVAKQAGRSRKKTSASKTTLRIDRILVPVDFSDCSLASLKYAIQFAEQCAAKILLLSAVDLGYAYTADGYAMCDLSAFRDIAREDVERQMSEFVRRAKFGGVKFETTIKIASPLDEICSFAEERNVDLIIMSTHGWTGFKHVLIGSTAEQVVRRAKRPVLVVPSHAALRAAHLTEGAEPAAKAKRKLVEGPRQRQQASMSEIAARQYLKAGAHPFPERRKTNKFRESHAL